MLYIDPVACVECGACADVCPVSVSAIYYEDELPSAFSRFTGINAGYFETHPLESGARGASAAAKVTPSDNGPLRVAIVGSGPTALYAAQHLIKRHDVEISLLERLPTSYGLLRAGVAPDHQVTKSMARSFDKILSQASVNLQLNVEVGRDRTHAELLEHHHALQLLDEITLTLNREVQRENRTAVEDAGSRWRGKHADRVRERMIEEYDRGGRSAGQGFYDYNADDTRVGLWQGLRNVFGPCRSIPYDDMRDRLLFVEVLEALRCLDEGIVGSEADADTGSNLGIGFPAHTGGVISFRRCYPDGAERFTDRARALAVRYGDRFLPPEQSPEPNDPPEYQ